MSQHESNPIKENILQRRSREQANWVELENALQIMQISLLNLIDSLNDIREKIGCLTAGYPDIEMDKIF